MRLMRQKKSFLALLALLFLFAACKGESPTAPPPSSGGGGTTTPPVGATLTLTASNATPLVDSVVLISAQVTQNGQPAPDGTGVEFQATGGTFSSTAVVTSVLRTTVNGVATVSLTSSVAGPINVQATVNNITRTVGVSFRVQDPTIPPTSTAPAITSVTPSLVIPTAGQHIRIIGKNFKTPLRVLFDVGGATPVEGTVIAVTDTTIDVLTPGVNVGAGQQVIGDITVITQAGTTSEQSASLADSLTFRNEVLTPRVSTTTPNSGPVLGGTRVTIIGDGFQAPVQVLFGAAEAKVISVDFTQIVVEAPAARDTSDNGSGPVTGSVSVTVRNINSQTATTLTSGFRYVAAVQITAAGPTEGPFTGGTRVTIDGNGFVSPVAISIGGIAAQPISVSGTKIVALTGAVAVSNCADVTGPIIVTNIVNGDTANGPQFIFRVLQPAIVSVRNPDPDPFPSQENDTTITAGDDVNVTVANAQPGVTRILLGGRSVFINTTNFDPSTGVAVFNVISPTNLTFPTEACTLGGVTGTRQVPIVVDVTYLNASTDCTDTATQALTILPPSSACSIPPPPNAVVTPTPPTCAQMGNVVAAGTVTGTTTITVTNTGGQPLIVNAVTVLSASNTTSVTVTPNSATIPAQGSQTFTITADPAAPGAFGATIRINSNDPDSGTIDSCFSGNGT
jgi:hypothetical protein